MSKSVCIHNRSYLGCKYKLLPFIKSVVSENCKDVNTFFDLFSGTGVVASAFTDRKIITNDILYSNFICHKAWFDPSSYSREKIEQYVSRYNDVANLGDNYMSENFSGTYFSTDDCRKIGFIREDIEVKFSEKQINERERSLLITSLLYAADKIANTCGHYDSFRKNSDFDNHLELSVPIPNESLHIENSCYNENANSIVKKVSADLVYIDPPYNSRQYCDAYHLLENVARWEKPDVSGIAGKMDRSNIKSHYCTNKATKALEDLIGNINARYILLSYNNMAQKGDGRSNAKIDDNDILRIFSKKGTVVSFEQEHKNYSIGNSDVKENLERLFLCTCNL